jgi:hypothetical protein
MSSSARGGESLLQAVEHLETGAWQQAHTIVQQNQSTLAAWLHGIVHILEGDLDNARGWYRRAGRPFPDPGSVSAEISAARRAVVEGSSPGA